MWSIVMPMAHLPEISANNRYQAFDASDVQFGTKFFFYRFLVTNRKRMLYFRAGLWYQFSGTGFLRRFLVRLS